MPKFSYRARRYGLLPRGAIGAARGAMTAYNAARSIQRFYRRFKKHGRYGAGLTNQYDRANIYKKKRMPYRKRKRWVKFVNKVRAVENKTLGTRTRVFNNRILITSPDLGTSTTPKQLFQSLTLYGNMDDATAHPQLGQVRNDIRQLLVDDPDIATSGKVQMISGIFDMTLVNASVDAFNNAMGIELDVYLIRASSRFEVVTGGTDAWGSLEAIMNNSLTATDAIGSKSKLNVDDLGATPFDFTTALSWAKIKIISKKKYFLPSGNQMTYQIRDPKNRMLSKEKTDNILGTNYPGATQHVLLIAKGLPGSATVPPSGDNPYKVRLEIGVTRKYAYKVNEDDANKIAFN